MLHQLIYGVWESLRAARTLRSAIKRELGKEVHQRDCGNCEVPAFKELCSWEHYPFQNAHHSDWRIETILDILTGIGAHQSRFRHKVMINAFRKILWSSPETIMYDRI